MFLANIPLPNILCCVIMRMWISQLRRSDTWFGGGDAGVYRARVRTERIARILDSAAISLPPQPNNNNKGALGRRRIMNCRNMLFVMALLVMVTVPSLAATWDLAGDFSLVLNPNGQWDYGQTAGAMTDIGYDYHYLTTISNMPGWCPVYAGWDKEALLYNNTGVNQTLAPLANGTTATILPGQIVFRNGQNGNMGVKVRWTAPSGGGSYNVSVNFARPTGGDAVVETAVVKNNLTMLLDTELNSSTPVSYSDVVTLAGGEWVDFYAGPKDVYASWWANNDTVVVSATISDASTPEPGSLIALVTGLVGIASFGIRRRR
jgi:hypothetical protein